MLILLKEVVKCLNNVLKRYVSIIEIRIEDPVKPKKKDQGPSLLKDKCW